MTNEPKDTQREEQSQRDAHSGISTLEMLRQLDAAGRYPCLTILLRQSEDEDGEEREIRNRGTESGS